MLYHLGYKIAVGSISVPVCDSTISLVLVPISSSPQDRKASRGHRGCAKAKVKPNAPGLPGPDDPPKLLESFQDRTGFGDSSRTALPSGRNDSV